MMGRLPSLRAAFLVGLAAFAATVGSDRVSSHEHHVLRGRLVFADHEKPLVYVLDLDSGEVTHRFEVSKANPSFSVAEGGRYVVVRSGDEAGTIRILDSGVVRDSHGDHDDVEKLTPKWLEPVVTGDRPSHVVSAHGLVALFYDGDRPWNRASDPKAVVIDLKSLAGGSPAVMVRLSAAPQHGIAVPLGGTNLLMTVANPAYAKGDDRSASPRPDGFEILDMRGRPESWKVAARFDDASRPAASCRMLHGYASAGRTHVFGCAGGEDGGLLVLARRDGRWAARKVAYPGEGRVSAIKGSGPDLVGDLGQRTPSDALVRIDPAATKLSAADVMKMPGGQAVCQFEPSSRGTRLASLTPDGTLRVYELRPAWREVASFDAVAAFDCSYGAATPTPTLAVVGPRAFVSDPRNGRIREYDLETLRQGLDLPVGGRPAHVAGGGAGG